MNALLAVDADAWREEMAAIEEYFDEYGDRLPYALREEHRQVVTALG
jgi:phosphoenolpyruvate carboxykinase (GTP)